MNNLSKCYDEICIKNSYELKTKTHNIKYIKTYDFKDLTSDLHHGINSLYKEYFTLYKVLVD